jgi:hypothetical protein
MLAYRKRPRVTSLGGASAVVQAGCRQYYTTTTVVVFFAVSLCSVEVTAWPDLIARERRKVSTSSLSTKPMCLYLCLFQIEL